MLKKTLSLKINDCLFVLPFSAYKTFHRNGLLSDGGNLDTVFVLKSTYTLEFKAIQHLSSHLLRVPCSPPSSMKPTSIPSLSHPHRYDLGAHNVADITWNLRAGRRTRPSFCRRWETVRKQSDEDGMRGVNTEAEKAGHEGRDKRKGGFSMDLALGLSLNL